MSKLSCNNIHNILFTNQFQHNRGKQTQEENLKQIELNSPFHCNFFTFPDPILSVFHTTNQSNIPQDIQRTLGEVIKRKSITPVGKNITPITLDIITHMSTLNCVKFHNKHKS